MRKKLIIPMLASILAAFLVAMPAAADETPQIVLNGRVVRSDVPPRIVSGRTLVPLRAIGEALEADVFWYEPKKTVVIVNDETEIFLVPGEATATVGGKEVPLDVPARIIDGRTMVPLRFVAEALGVGVDWDGTARRVLIADDKHPASPAALDAFLAGQQAIAGWPNYRADFEMRVKLSGGGEMKAVGTSDTWPNGNGSARMTVTMATPEGFVIQSPPAEVRRVDGRQYTKMGDDPWELDWNAQPEGTDTERVKRLMKAVREHPELVKRAFERPFPDGPGRVVGVVLEPGILALLGDNPQPGAGYATMTMHLGPGQEPLRLHYRIRVFDHAHGGYGTTTFTFSNFRPGAAEPVAAPDPEDMAPANQDNYWSV